MSRLATLLRSILTLALALSVIACATDKKEIAEEDDAIIPTESTIGQAGTVTTTTGSAAQLIPNITNSVSVGAEVVDGEVNTYSPPPVHTMQPLKREMIRGYQATYSTSPTTTSSSAEVTNTSEKDKSEHLQSVYRGFVSNSASTDGAPVGGELSGFYPNPTTSSGNYTIRGGRGEEAKSGSYKAIRAEDIATGAVTTDEILNETILAQDIAPGTVTTDEILSGTVSSKEIIDGLVTNINIADNAVPTRKVQDGQIMNVNIAFDAVDVRLIQNETLRAEIPLQATPGSQDGSSLNVKDKTDSLTLNNREQNQNQEQIQEIIAQPEPPRKPSVENHFRATESSPYSTFSIDVDNASYSNVRGYLNRGQLPPPDAVRVEELVNYFKYDYPEPTDGTPFAFNSEVVVCPWNKDHLLLRLALQGREIQAQQAEASNLVFLIDVSGSMSDANKLPLLKESLKKLVDQLRPEDRVAIVVYAGAAGLVLEPTSGSNKKAIRDAIDRLSSGGSTAGGAGIELAYKTARKNFLPEGVNRVILATDGDFNVGVSSEDGLVKLIEEKRKDGVFLSVLGFGTGNYQDKKMEQLADHGNGNYYYIDKLEEGKRVLVDEMSGTLYAIAKDVKLQLKFNEKKVAAYRLIGYENRVLAARDFDDDTKDAGELGAGHQVTALYEVVPVGAAVGYELDTTATNDYQLENELPELMTANDLLMARLRYKEPTDSVSKATLHLVQDERKGLEKASESTRFAAAVAGWGMLLRGSTYSGTISYNDVVTWGEGARGSDSDGYRSEFIDLVKKSASHVQGSALSDTK
ncbi:MAG: von Willebrand factor type A domain-containing protein [Candidatus Kapaibacterium sp.]